MSVQVHEYQPDPVLAPFVLWYWEGTFNTEDIREMSQRVIPNGYVELIIHLTDNHCHLPTQHGWSISPDYTIIGLYSQPYDVQFPQRVNTFGIRFKPEGIYHLFGVPAAAFKANYEDMALVMDKAFQEFCQKLKEAEHTHERIKLTNTYLLQMLGRQNDSPNYVHHAAELIRRTKGNIRIEALAEETNISLRQLQRQFKSQIGVSPKHYLQMARMNEVQRLLTGLKELSFTELAYHTGYADQAHFIRDFKRLTGEKPTIFVRESQQFLVNPTLKGR